MDLDADLSVIVNDEMNFQIACELIREKDPNQTDKQCRAIWEHCGGNPWNAGIMFDLVQLAK